MIEEYQLKSLDMLGGFEILLKSILKRLKINNKQGMIFTSKDEVTEV